jgi:hypothetical protein
MLLVLLIIVPEIFNVCLALEDNAVTSNKIVTVAVANGLLIPMEAV